MNECFSIIATIADRCCSCAAGLTWLASLRDFQIPCMPICNCVYEFIGFYFLLLGVWLFRSAKIGGSNFFEMKFRLRTHR